MHFLTRIEKAELQRILTQRTILSNADPDIWYAVLSNCGLQDFLPQLRNYRRIDHFIIKLISIFSNESIIVGGSERLCLIQFIEYLRATDTKLNTDDKAFFDLVIEKWKRSKHTNPQETDRRQITELLEHERQKQQIPGSTLRSVKIDKGIIVNFDLESMVAKYIQCCGYEGIFAFSVGGNYTVLERYIIERIFIEHKNKTKRECKRIDVCLYHNDISTGIQVIEEKISASQNCNQLEDLFSENLLLDIVLIIWNFGIPEREMVEIATSFFHNAQTRTITYLHNQSRCFVIIWANVEEEPLKEFDVLPIPEKFELSSLIQWVRSWLKPLGIDDSLMINIIRRLKNQDGHLLGTFMELESIINELKEDFADFAYEEQEVKVASENQVNKDFSPQRRVSGIASTFIDYAKILKQHEHEHARQAVDRFVKRFDESYRMIVYYSALPLILTPELVNYLRNQFLREDNVPWVAEVDLLLSDLCKEVGYELYTMDTAVRAYALSKMRLEVGVEKMQDVARLLINYVQQLSRANPFIGKHELQAQQWAAMAYLDDKREDVAREIAESFRNSVSITDETVHNSPVANRPEMLRLSRLVEAISTELGEYSDLVTYAQDVKQLLTDPKSLENDQLHREHEILGQTLPRLKDLAEVNLDNDFDDIEIGPQCFNWLHFSDFHWGIKDQQWLWPGIREILFEDLKKLHDRCGPWDLVLFTGDLTQTGSAEEFNRVNSFLEQLWNQLANLGSKPKLLAVPGNHDLVRPNTIESSLHLLEMWDSQVQREFWNNAESSYRHVISKAFENYTAWHQNQPFKPDALNLGTLPGDFSVTIYKGSFKLGIVGLNTAFLQLTGNNYQGKLVLHPRQFHSVCGGDGLLWVNQHHTCLLLTHHSPRWLNPESQKLMHAEITAHERFAVHLCGNLHENFPHIPADGVDTWRIWQGKSFFGMEYFNGEMKRMHGYTAGRIELEGSQGRLFFWPRETRLVGAKRKMVPDFSVDITDDQHTKPIVFNLLAPY